MNADEGRTDAARFDLSRRNACTTVALQTVDPSWRGPCFRTLLEYQTAAGVPKSNRGRAPTCEISWSHRQQSNGFVEKPDDAVAHVDESNYPECSDMPNKTPITVAHGDGIGPEIMNATLQILEAAGAALDIETIEIGEKVYLRGNTSGIEPSSWESLLRTKVFLKAPITTPQGGGFKSLNVTTRKTLGQYANVRPCVSYHPFIDTKHPNMDVVIVRENEEDLYAGIEYQMTP